MEKNFLSSEFLLNNDTSLINQTVIDGGGTHGVIEIENGENSSCQIYGLTIQNGSFNGCHKSSRRWYINC